MSKPEVQVIVRSSKPKPTEEPAPSIDLDKVREDIAQHIRDTVRLVCGQEARASVNWIKGDKTTVYKLCVEQRILGKVLGAKGGHINGLRALVQAMCGNHGFRGVIDAPETFEYGALTPKTIAR